MWSWHNNPISAADIGLSCQIQSLSSFQAAHPCGVLKLLKTQRKVSSFVDCWKNVNKTIIEYGFCMISWKIKPHVCVICLSLWLQQVTPIPPTPLSHLHSFFQNTPLTPMPRAECTLTSTGRLKLLAFSAGGFSVSPKARRNNAAVSSKT